MARPSTLVPLALLTAASLGCAPGLETRSRGSAELAQGVFRTVVVRAASPDSGLELARAGAERALVGRGYEVVEGERRADLVVTVGEDAEGRLELVARAPDEDRVLWRGEVEAEPASSPDELDAALRRLMVGFAPAAPKPVAY